MKEFVAFEGDEYTVEWYYDEKGKSASLEYFEKLTNERKRKVLQLFRLMGNMGKIRNEQKFRFEGDKIFAFKPKPDRFLCFFFTGSKVVVTNAFEKKTKKLPSAEKERALRFKRDYEERVKKGEYYE